MKSLDLETYYKLKGNLEDSIEELPDNSKIKPKAKNHLLRIEDKMERQIDTIISGGIDDIYYINEIIKATHLQS